jgi:Flp pilus assembly protein TadG
MSAQHQRGRRIMMKRLKGQRGAALLETAITLPLILLVSVSIFEFGRAYQTWQVLTNAAREGARIACLPDYTDTQVTTTVTNYMNGGRLNGASAQISVVRNVPFGATTASRVTVNYPFQFVFLGPVARLVRGNSTMGAPLTMSSSALMRNE